MKVKCIKLKTDMKKGVVNNEFYQDNNKIGDIFTIYGIFIIQGTPNVLIEVKNYSSLLLYDLELFEIIDNDIPNIWKIKVSNSGSIKIAPEIVLKDYFLDYYSDGEPEYVNEFKKIKHLCE